MAPRAKDTSDIYGERYLHSGLSKDEVSKRVKALQSLLADLDQDTDKREDLRHAAQALVQPFIFDNTDKTIKLLAACCLADIIRIFAPDAPYSDPQLKKIFTMFVNQLKGLEKPDGQLFPRYFYLLERLAIVKAFSILIDLNAHDTLVHIFESFFNIIKPEHSNKVQTHMLDIMGSIIEDYESVPTELLETILARLVPPLKDENPEGYKLAARFIERCPHLEGSVTVYLNSIIVDNQHLESDLREKIDDIIFEINHYNPKLLLYVMPNLVTQLKTDDIETRMQSVTLLSRILVDSKSTSSSLDVSNALLSDLCARFDDISPKVREHITRLSTKIVVQLGSENPLTKAIMGALSCRLLDQDEKVRREVVPTMCSIAYSVPSAIPEKLMKDVLERMRDKKESVYTEAIQRVVELYCRIYAHPGEDVGQFKVLDPVTRIIPGKLLLARQIHGPDTKVLIDSLIDEKLFPSKMSPTERAHRLLHIPSAGLDAVHSLEQFLDEKRKLQDQLNRYLDLRAKWKQNQEDEEVNKTIGTVFNSIALHFPNPAEGCKLLHRWHDLKDNKIFNSVATSINQSKDISDSNSALVDALSRIGSKSPVHEYMSTVLRRASFNVFGRSQAGGLVQIAKENSDLAPEALSLLQMGAQYFPNCVAPHLEEISTLLKDHRESVTVPVLRIMTVTGHLLQQLFPSLPESLNERLLEFCKTGTPTQAKHTVLCLKKIHGDDVADVIRPVFKEIVDEHIGVASPLLLTKLQFLAQVASSVPLLFAEDVKICGSIVKSVITAKVDENEDEEELADEDAEDPNAPSLLAKKKIATIKMLVRHLEADPKSPTVNPVLRMITCQVDTDENPSDNDAACLRLAAACAVLRLARIPAYQERLEHSLFQKVAYVLLDTPSHIREKLIKKVEHGIMKRNLRYNYAAMLAFAAIDSDKENVLKAKAAVRRIMQRMRLHHEAFMKKTQTSATLASSKTGSLSSSFMPESLLPWVVHLVAHSPFYEEDKENNFKSSIQCLRMFIDPLLEIGESYTYMIQLLLTIKQTDDATDPSSESIYCIAELAQTILKQDAGGRLMKDTNTFPGPYLLPSTIYKKPEDKDKVTRRLTKLFIPDDIDIKRTPAHTPASGKKGLADTPRSAVETPTTRALTFEPVGDGKASGKKRGRKPGTKGGKKKAKAKHDETDNEGEGTNDEHEQDENEDPRPPPPEPSRRLPSRSARSQANERLKDEKEGKGDDEEGEGEDAKKGKLRTSSSSANSGSKKRKSKDKSSDHEEEEEEASAADKKTASKKVTTLTTINI
mmetsp:Transcript_13616/g.22441  ORF Transcript_13616/g.22441 Transcript_13616/m.22441 type:complete len:1290 (-) Transcript_13616:585-4454(-)|eukprot:CAMPEP_0184672368 /NCGR_PEP_ID=MMETSP0308-20130426/86062_1 /TAXON_ID=38269 /ORGANISM="Gloeochaete witrockiana, Strain SAG 46.84" /LENGTH=1289 /DNA_ID=CAMNT_0027119687 /DNA_START=14 /DNA_END=3883 /DNA_ORIENTATION=+